MRQLDILSQAEGVTYQRRMGKTGDTVLNDDLFWPAVIFDQCPGSPVGIGIDRRPDPFAGKSQLLGEDFIFPGKTVRMGSAQIVGCMAEINDHIALVACDFQF